MAEVKISLEMSKLEAFNFAQLVKRLSRRNLGRDGLGLVTHEEDRDAETVLYRLRDVLADAGYDPR